MAASNLKPTGMAIQTYPDGTQVGMLMNGAIVDLQTGKTLSNPGAGYWSGGTGWSEGGGANTTPQTWVDTSGLPPWTPPAGTPTTSWGEATMYDPDPGHTFLEKIWPYATAALGGGAIAGGLGAAGGAGAGWTTGAGETLGGGLGSAFGMTEGVGAAGAAGGGGMFDFIQNAFSGLGDFGSSIGNFISNAFSASPVGPEQVGAGFPLASEAGASLGNVTGLAEAGGGIGDFFTNAFSNLGTNFQKNPLSVLSNLASTIQGFSSANDVRAAGRDPLGGYRQNAAAQLNNLMANPNLISQYPGYQAGLEGVLRGSAAAGYTASGNELAALQKYGGQFYNDEIARLAKIAGFDFSPVQLTAGQQEAEQQATNLIARALGNLGFMFRPQGRFATAGAR